MTCYILWSPSLQKYYIGSTLSSVEERLQKHNHSFYGSTSFSSQTSDWEVYYELPCVCKTQMLKIEKHIKSMKSRIYLENLRKYPELSTKLLKKYDCME